MNSPVNHRRMLTVLACGCLTLAGGCATLPQAGPIGKTIVREGERGAFDLVEVDSSAALPAPPKDADYRPLPTMWTSAAEAIAPRDAISVTYYEIGARVFSGGASAAGGAFDPAATQQTVGPIEVDQAGMIRPPYTGLLRAAGRTPMELARDIEAALGGKSENPQVIVRLEAANGSSVLISGEVASPGRIRLTGARESLLDVIALAGGQRGERRDVLVQINRQGSIREVPLAGLTYTNIGGMALEPGDRIALLRRSRSYSILGSANRVNQYELPLRQMSLVEALAAAGGPSENVADPGAVFVFRFENTGPDGAERPVVYHFNMLQPSSYLLGQQFQMADKDVLYIAGAEANQPSKLLQMVGQVFNPLIVARQVAE